MTPDRCSWFLDLAQMTSVGRELGRVLIPGLTLALVGPLGAGKTTFTKSVVEGAGGNPSLVTSPTFVLMHEYQASIPIIHVDAYRLQRPADFLELALEEWERDAVIIVEWADRVRPYLSSECLEISFSEEANPGRRLSVRADGDRSKTVLTQWMNRITPSIFLTSEE